MAEALKIQFARDLAENLFPDNTFHTHSRSDDEFVDGKKVVLGHAGTQPTVELNRTTQATSAKRADDNSEYDIDELSSDPTWLQYSEELILNYGKRASILYNHKMGLMSSCAAYLLAKWAANTSSTILDTTGATRPAGVGTGNRKALTLDDLIAVQMQMDKDDIPQEGRIAVITPTMKADMLKIKEVQSADFNASKALVKGSIGHFLGFDFFIRSSVNRYDTVGDAMLGYGGTTADTDEAAALFYNKDFVRRAKAGVKVFLELDQPTKYGSEFSALLRVGGITARKDGKGVVSLKEVTV